MPLTQNTVSSKRILSLDVMRGLIMILLAAESCRIYESLYELELPGFTGGLIRQFFHHPWHGLHFWDLVQPAFMMMAGSAMFISYYYKTQEARPGMPSGGGISWKQNFKHIVRRSVKLFICGVALHCVYAGKLVWELWNVLTQLSVTTIIAYLIIRKSPVFQIIFSVALLLLTDILYRLMLMPGYEQPFVSGHNFGNWMDVVLMGKTNSDGWVAINIIPTAAHTIWGVLAGKLLVTEIKTVEKIKLLLIGAAVCLLLGYGLNALNITPIIKRIATSSFVLSSAGWVLLIMAFLYWLVDIKQWNKYASVFVAVGMNAIFIYLFFETVGSQWLNGVTAIFVKGLLGFTGMNKNIMAIFSALTTLLIEWSLCYWLYKRKIFLKL
ncbi:MAG: DUF5009 domain-containing protein [Ferruginibacter sp.]